MLSGSGNNSVRGLVLGSSTVAGIAALPNTSGQNWLLFTAVATLVIGAVMLLMRALAELERRRS